MAGEYPDDEAVDLPATTPQSLATALHSRRSDYVRRRTIRVKIGTWNVAACPGTDKDLASWFLEDEAADAIGLKNLDIDDDKSKNDDAAAKDSIGLYVLGLQEVVDLNMTKEYMNRTINADFTPTDKWQAALEAAMPAGYRLVATDQMVGLILFIYASPEALEGISNVSTKQVGTGLLGYFGNKGAIASRIMLGEATKLVFINSHLSSGAGQSYLERRYWDVSQILAKTVFDPIISMGRVEEEGEKIGDEDFAFWFGDLNFRLDGLPGDDIRHILTLHTRGEYDLSGNSKHGTSVDEPGVVVTKGSETDDSTTSSLYSREESFDTATSLPDPDDFPEDPSQDPASLQATIDSLLPHDQLKKSIARKQVFHDGWREGPVTFLPTYKYDVGSVSLFDTSEKQRAPSWCDRILYRTRLDMDKYVTKAIEELENKKKDDEMKKRGLEEDDDVLFSYDPEDDGEDVPAVPPPAAPVEYDEYNEDEDVPEEGAGTSEGATDRIHQSAYESYQRVTSSDHKPLVSYFTLDYDCVIPELKAQVYAEVARELDRAENENRPGITIATDGDANAIDFGEIGFLQKKTSSITIANTGGVDATVSFVEKDSFADDDKSTPWVSTILTHGDDADAKQCASITLKPGEIAVAAVTAQVTSVPFLRSLNDGIQSLEDILVLRVEGGRDHFLAARATWQPTCFGRSIDELIRVPEGGIRAFIKAKDIKGAIPYDFDVQCSAPRELFKLTEAIQTLSERCVADAAMLEGLELPGEPGWPLDSGTWTGSPGELDALKASVIDALDRDVSVVEVLPVELPSPHRLELLSSVLLLFLSSLTDGLVPAQLAAKMSTNVPNLNNLPASSWPDVKLHILDIMSSVPSHNIAFVFLTTALARVATELIPVTKPEDGIKRRLSFKKADDSDGAVRRRAREVRYAEVLAPVVFRDKSVLDKSKSILEFFLKKDVDG